MYWRISQFLMPNHALRRRSLSRATSITASAWVPVDDVNCWIYTYSWLPDRPFTNSEREKYAKGLRACTPRSTTTTCPCATSATTT